MDLRRIRPTVVEVYLDRIAHNVSELRRVTKKEALFMAVVKADGYGHGAEETAKTALAAGADCLGVALIEEGINLRKAGVFAPILILGYTPEALAQAAVSFDLTVTLFSLQAAREFSEAAIARNKKLKVHIKVDTGMGRIGFMPGEESAHEIKQICSIPGLEVEGMFTHFATADQKDKSYALGQFEQFMAFDEMLGSMGVNIPIKHCANSAAIIDLPETHLDMVRAGVAIYGLYPSDEVQKEKVDLKPAMAFKTHISHVKQLPEGFSISYGATFTTRRRSTIATLPVGYADGFSRLLSGKAKLLVLGQEAPLVGRVCMDQCMIDVTGIEGVSPGDEAVIFGEQAGSLIIADKVASLMGTINYEVVCMVGKRVPRVYYEEGKPVKVRSGLKTDIVG